MASAAEFEVLRDCFKSNVRKLEPYQDNMLDLAAILFTTTCEDEKKSFFDSRETHDEDMMNLHYSMMQILVQQMVIEARASRLDIQLN